MQSIVTGKRFAEAVCEVMGIDYKKHPVLGIDAVAEQDAMTEIRVRFAVPYGLLSQIDAAMKDIGGE